MDLIFNTFWYLLFTTGVLIVNSSRVLTGVNNLTANENGVQRLDSYLQKCSLSEVLLLTFFAAI